MALSSAVSAVGMALSSVQSMASDFSQPVGAGTKEKKKTVPLSKDAVHARQTANGAGGAAILGADQERRPQHHHGQFALIWSGRVPWDPRPRCASKTRG